MNRAGTKIAYAAAGTGDEDDGFGLYQGTIAGNFKKRGSRWSTSLIMNGTQAQMGTMVKTAAGKNISGKQ